MTDQPVSDFERGVEATLFASAEPLSIDRLADYVGEGDIRSALFAIRDRHAGTGIAEGGSFACGGGRPAEPVAR